MSSAVEQYPQLGFFRVMDFTTAELGSYVLAESGDLKLAEMRVFSRATTLPFSYDLRLIVSSSAGGPELTSSDVVTFSDTVIGQTTADWLGEITFDFDGYSLLAGESYYFRMEAIGYVRNGDADYLSFSCDWLEPLGVTDTGGAKIAIGVLQ